MPNWCYNELVVSGEAADLKHFYKTFKGPHLNFAGLKFEVKEGFSFQNIIPIDTLEIEESIKSGKCLNLQELVYQFKKEKWGVKSDIDPRELVIYGEDKLMTALDNDVLSISFDFYTPWSPCLPIIEAMASNWNKLNFTYSYDESGMGIAGKCIYKKGQILSMINAGEDYRRFCKDVFNYSYYECVECNSLYEEYEVHYMDYICEECESTRFISPDGHLIDYSKEDTV